MLKINKSQLKVQDLRRKLLVIGRLRIFAHGITYQLRIP
jgi:hypothetical protein